MTSQPELAMLWERTDPHTALTDRFGFADPRRATAWLADLLRERWGVRLLSCDRLVISAGNVLAWLTTNAGRMVAKCSAVAENHARLAEVSQLLVWLSDRGLPVSAPIPALDGRPQLEADGKSIGLQRELSGAPLDVTDPRQVRTAGATLAELHLTLADYPGAEQFVPRQQGTLSQRIAGWLDSGAGTSLAPLWVSRLRVWGSVCRRRWAALGGLRRARTLRIRNWGLPGPSPVGRGTPRV